MPAGTVEVLLIGATGIKDTELFGKADPYAVLKCGRQTLRSNVATNQGSKPIWNQRFSFYIDDSVTELQLKILNHNIFKEDDEIGSTTIPLTRVFAEYKLPTTSYNVVRPSGRVQGELKFSLTFTPKKKPGLGGGATPTGSVVSYSGSSHGPYSSRSHPGPYRQPEPEPTHKHDPLTGPYGYYKNSSSSVTGSVTPYGSGVGAWVDSSNVASTRPAHAGVSDGSSRLGHGGTMSSVTSDAYPAGSYPHVGSAVNSERLSSYPGTDSSASSYLGGKVSTPVNGSSHGPLYPHPSSYPSTAPPDYGSLPYCHPPYDHAPRTSSPSEHGSILRPPASQYPPIGAHGSSYSAAPSQKPRHSTVSQYHIDEVTAGISGMGISGHAGDGSSHDGYRQNALPTSRPPATSYHGESFHPHAGYNPAPPSHERAGAEYLPPVGYPPAGYSPQGSGHGKPPASEYPSAYPPAGYPPGSDGMSGSPLPGAYPPPYSLNPGPPSSYYPPQAGYPYPGQRDSYPPVPFYNAHPTPYVPAGYPK